MNKKAVGILLACAIVGEIPLIANNIKLSNENSKLLSEKKCVGRINNNLLKANKKRFIENKKLKKANSELKIQNTKLNEDVKTLSKRIEAE